MFNIFHEIDKQTNTYRKTKIVPKEERELRGGEDEDFPRERHRSRDDIAMDEAGHKPSDFY